MASFDIKSLFMPYETITSQPTPFSQMKILQSKDSLLRLQDSLLVFSRKLLQFAVKNGLFIFNDKLYQQIDDVAIGNHLGPTLANLFSVI